MTRYTALFLAAALLAPVSAQAGELVDAATKAEQFAADGKYIDAVKAMEAAQDTLWNAAPLMFRRALFAAADPQGYGLYDLREDNTFKRTEPLFIYSEPMGYAYGKDGTIYVLSIDLDFVIKSPDGKEVTSQQNFANLNYRSRFPNKEFMAKVTYDFSGIPAGDYTVTTIFKDKNSSKTGEFTLPFKLVD